MAVTDVKTTKSDWKATIKKPSSDYTVGYLVTVDDADDGPEVITEHEDLPRIGEKYEVGNDATAHKCLSKTFTNLDTFTWKVIAKFGAPEGKKNKNEGQQNDDENETPFIAPPTLAISMVRTEIVASYGAYLGYYLVNNAGDPDPLVKEGLGPLGIPKNQNRAKPGNVHARGGIQNGTGIVNSAYAPYDPPLKRDRSRVSFRVGMNLPSFPVDHYQYIDCVNADKWTLSHPWHNIVHDFKPYTCKLQSITGSFKYQEAMDQVWPFWAVEYEFHYDPVFTWRVDLLDYGFSESALAPSHPLYYSTGQPGNATRMTAAVGANGLPSRDPVKLDGQGMALDPAGQTDAVFIRWAIYPEVKWKQKLENFFNFAGRMIG